MPARFFFSVLFILFAIQAQAQYEQLLHKSFAQRYLALEHTFYSGKYLSRDSSIVFPELDRLETAAQKAGDEDLQLEAQMLRCEYYMFGKQENHKAFETRMQGLKALADQKEIKHLQIRTRHKLGYYYFYALHKYGPGLDNYLSSYQLMKDIPVKDLPNKQELVADIGSAYFIFGDNTNARKFLTEAWQTAPSYKKRLPINLTNTLGLIYREELKFDSAEYYLRKTYRMAQALQDSTWMGIAAGNIGILYFNFKKYDAAIPLLAMDVRLSLKAREIDNAITSLITLSKISLLQKDYPKAETQIKQINLLLPTASDRVKHLKDFFPLQAKLYALKGDFSLAYLYSDSAHFAKDSIYARKNSTLVSAAQRKIDLEKHHAEMQKLEAQEKLQKTLRNSLIVGILLLVIIALLVINRQRLVHQQKQQKLQNEKNSIASELEIASRQLNDFTNHIREKNKLIEKYSAEIEKQKDLVAEPELRASQEARDKLLQATILTDDQWEEFRQVFDKVHNGYLQRLREKLPKLSPAETRYFVLSKLNLTAKEMASMLGVRPDAIRLYRHRLRKKLELPDDNALDAIVKNI